LFILNYLDKKIPVSLAIVRYKKYYFERNVAKTQRRKEKLKSFCPDSYRDSVLSLVAEYKAFKSTIAIGIAPLGLLFCLK